MVTVRVTNKKKKKKTSQIPYYLTRAHSRFKRQTWTISEIYGNLRKHHWTVLVFLTSHTLIQKKGAGVVHVGVSTI